MNSGINHYLEPNEDPKYSYIEVSLPESEYYEYLKNKSDCIETAYIHHPGAREIIFELIEPEILFLSKTIKGNYLLQEIMKLTSWKSKKILVKLKGSIKELCLHEHGTFVIQLLIEKINNYDDILNELKGHYYELIKDQNGNRSVQALIKQNKKGNEEIYEEIKDKICDLAKNEYGCYVLQELLKNCNKKIFNEIYKVTKENIKNLVTDESGNYLLQYFLENEIENKKEYLDKIYKAIIGHIFDYCKDKIGSRIIQKILKLGDDIQRNNIINEILNFENMHHGCFAFLSKDKYGNHVVQSLLRFSKKSTKDKIAKIIKSDIGVQRFEGYSLHVLEYIEQIEKNK